MKTEVGKVPGENTQPPTSDRAAVSRTEDAVGVVLAVGLVLLAAAADKPRRTWAVQEPVAESSLPSAPSELAAITASPLVTCPTQTVARFSVTPLPIIASVVIVRRVHELALARVGGRHGP